MLTRALFLSTTMFTVLFSNAYAQDTLFDTYVRSAGDSYKKKDFREAESLYKLAVAEGDKAGIRDKRMVEAHYWLARSYSWNNKNDLAEEHFLKAVGLARDVLPAHDPIVLMVVRGMAARFIDAKKFEMAKPYVDWLVDANESVRGKNSAETADAYLLLGLTQKGLKKPEEASQAFAKALAAEEARDKKYSEVAARCCFQLGDIADAMTKNDVEAISRFRDAAERYEKSGKDGLDRAVDSLARLAAIYSRKKETDQAAKVQAEIEEVFRRAGSDAKGNQARFYYDQAWAELDKKDYKEAETFARKAIDLYEGLADGNSNQGFAYVVLARVAKEKGKNDDALRSYEEAVRVMTRLRGAEHLDTAWVQYDLADFYADQGKHAEAIKQAANVLFIREKKLDAKDLRIAPVLATLSISYSALEKWPDALEAADRLIKLREDVQGKDHVDLAWALRQSAFIHEKRGEKADAEKLLKRALEIREKKYGKGSAEATYDTHRLARFYQSQGRPTEAEALFRTAVAEREKVLGKDHPDLAPALSGLAGFLVSEGKYDEAEKLLKQAVANREKGSESRELAQSISELADFYLAVARYNDSISLYNRAVTIYEKADGANSKSVAKELSRLWWPYSRAGRYAEGLPVARRAVQILEQLGVNDMAYEATLNTLASSENHQKNYAEAEVAYRKALSICEASNDKKELNSAVVMNNLAQLLIARDEFAEAEKLLKRSIAIEEKAGVLSAETVSERLHEAANLARCHSSLAGLYHTMGLLPEADSHARRALEIREEHLGKTHPDLSSSLSQLAYLAAERGEYAKTEALLARAAAIRSHAFKPEESRIVGNHTDAAYIHRHHGRFDDAEREYRIADAILDKLYSGDPLEVAWLWKSRGSLALSRGRPEDAEKFLRKALDYYAKASEGRIAHASALLVCAGYDQDQADYAAAESKLNRAAAIYEKAFGKESPQLAEVTAPLAGLDITLGRYVAARERLIKVKEWQEKKTKENPAILSTMAMIAELDILEGHSKQAEIALEQVLSTRASVYGQAHYGSYHPLGLKAEALLRLDKTVDAEAPARESFETADRVLGIKHPETALAGLRLARVLISKGDNAYADKVISSAREAIERRPAAHPDRAELAWVTAKLAASSKKVAEAERAFQEAMRLRDKNFSKDHPETRRLLTEYLSFLTSAGKSDIAKELQSTLK